MRPWAQRLRSRGAKIFDAGVGHRWAPAGAHAPHLRANIRRSLFDIYKLPRPVICDTAYALATLTAYRLAHTAISLAIYLAEIYTKTVARIIV
jgi:hypothetical protein